MRLGVDFLFHELLELDLDLASAVVILLEAINIYLIFILGIPLPFYILLEPVLNLTTLFWRNRLEVAHVLGLVLHQIRLLVRGLLALSLCFIFIVLPPGRLFRYGWLGRGCRGLQRHLAAWHVPRGRLALAR